MEASSIKICQMCKNCMKDPRILPCAHSFCLKCLESSTVSSKSSSCPTCHVKYEVPEGGVKDMKRNEFIKSLNNVTRELYNCDCCKANRAVSYCYDCSYNYCSNCLVYHDKFPANVNHHLEPNTTKLEKIKIVSKYQICNDHLDPMNLYCKDCKTLMCGLCLSTNHKDHNMLHISEYLDLRKNELKNSIKFNEDLLGSILANHKSSCEKLSEAETNAKKACSEIKERGELLKKTIDLIVAEYVGQINDHVEIYQKNANKIVEKLVNMEIEIGTHLEFLRKQIDEFSYDNVIELSTLVPIAKKDVPQLSNNFIISFEFDSNNPMMGLKPLLGNIRKDPYIHYIDCNGPYEHFITNENDIIMFRRAEIDVFINSNDDGMMKTSNYDCKNFLDYICDLVIIENKLFVLGVKFTPKKAVSRTAPSAYKFYLKGFIKIVRFDSMWKYKPLELMEFPTNFSSSKLWTFRPSLSKSMNGNLLLCKTNSIVMLDVDGKITKEITLTFCIKSVVSLDQERFLVRRVNGKNECALTIIDACGKNCSSYSAVITCARRVFVDAFGFIYYRSNLSCREINVLDSTLNVRSSIFTNKDVESLYYDSKKHIIFVSTDTSDTSDTFGFLE